MRGAAPPVYVTESLALHPNLFIETDELHPTLFDVSAPRRLASPHTPLASHSRTLLQFALRFPCCRYRWSKRQQSTKTFDACSLGDGQFLPPAAVKGSLGLWWPEPVLCVVGGVVFAA